MGQSTEPSCFLIGIVLCFTGRSGAGRGESRRKNHRTRVHEGRLFFESEAGGTGAERSLEAGRCHGTFQHLPPDFPVPQSRSLPMYRSGGRAAETDHSAGRPVPDRLILDGDYEVGLSEIIYPHSWYNINTSNNRYWFGFSPEPGLELKFFLPTGYYADGSDLASALNRIAQNAIDEEAPNRDLKIKFHFDPISNRFNIEFRSKGSPSKLLMSEKLKKLLGFDGVMSGLTSMYTLADNPVDLNQNLDLIYVYCDIASHQCVGDIKAPLLRVVNVSGKHRTLVRNIYTHPIYVPVGRRDFDSIQISLLSQSGKPIPFQFGKSVVTLHFRKKSSLLSL